MAEDNIDSISDAEIFEAANEPAPPVEKETPEVKAENSETKESRERDEKGRFTAKAEASEEAAPKAETPQADTPPAKEDRPDHIPSWRLREEAEARRESERRAAQLEQMLAQYEERLAALQPKPEATPFPDIYSEPDALPQYINRMMEQERSRYQQEMKAAVANMSLQRASDKHGDSFTQAFNEITSRPLSDPVRQQVINSPDPGETLVNLWKREQTLKEVGNDTNAYRQKIRDEALSDPEFLEKALEAARAKAGASPANKIAIPPSLSKVSAVERSAGKASISDADIFNYANKR